MKTRKRTISEFTEKELKQRCIMLTQLVANHLPDATKDGYDDILFDCNQLLIMVNHLKMRLPDPPAEVTI